MKPKPENPVIAVQTFTDTLALLNLPAKVEGEHPNLKISVHVGVDRDLGYETVAKSSGLIEIFELVSGKRIPLTTARDLPEALVGILYAAVVYLMNQCNEKAVSDFVKASGQQHSVFCENCRQLVSPADFGTKACKTCESEN